MNWINIAKFPKPQNLAAFQQFLSSRGIEYKITEELEQYCLWVCEKDRESVIHLIEAFSRERNTTTTSILGLTFNNPKASLIALLKVPVTVLLIFVCTGLFIADELGSTETIRAFIFMPIGYLFATHEWWRLFTPALLHGGWLHLIFNMLWAWELGVRLEHYLGVKKFLLLVILAGVFSNLVQYIISDNIHFRGLSGVVYAYVGMLWLYGKYAASRELFLPDSLYIFMFVWLGLGVFGIVEWIMPGNMKIANGAHIGGLIIGLALAKLLIYIDRRSKRDFTKS